MYYKAAEQGYTIARFDLGRNKGRGHGAQKDFSEATRWYRTSSLWGHECDGSFDYTEVIKWYQTAAEHGDTEAQFVLGCCYDQGQGVQPNVNEAVKWFRLAAENGFSTAQFVFGLCRELGHGGSADYAEAAKWYGKAAAQGDDSARFILGWCYELGHGVPQDFAQAAIWYRKVGILSALDGAKYYRLGLLYFQAGYLPTDLPEAYKWLKLAAAEGHHDAAEKLASLLSIISSSQLQEGEKRHQEY